MNKETGCPAVLYSCILGKQICGLPFSVFHISTAVGWLALMSGHPIPLNKQVRCCFGGCSPVDRRRTPTTDQTQRWARGSSADIGALRTRLGGRTGTVALFARQIAPLEASQLRYSRPDPSEGVIA